MSSCVGGVAERPPSVCVCLALRKLCVLIGIDCGLSVDIRPVASQHLITNGASVLEAQGGAIGLASPFRLGFRSIGD